MKVLETIEKLLDYADKIPHDKVLALIREVVRSGRAGTLNNLELKKALDQAQIMFEATQEIDKKHDQMLADKFDKGDEP